jgi:uncharacterized protein YjbI with pentapeptide repeats
MADEEHVALLKQGVEGWNKWREENPNVLPTLSWAKLSGADLAGANLSGANLSEADLFKANLSKANLSKADLSLAKLSGAVLSGAKLSGADLPGADLSGATLSEATLSGATLSGADLSGAKLSGANLSEADLSRAVLSGADLSRAVLSGANLSEATLYAANLFGANFSKANFSKADLSRADLFWAVLSGADLAGANLSGANLSEADLSRADLMYANLVEADFTDTDLTGCHIYGISAWGLKLSEDTKQRNLIITKEDEPEITVDDLEVAQFIYLLLHNEKIRRVIDTITSKAVLILGRFTPERKAVLDALREELRKRNYLPILFDFDKPASQDLTQTVATLARLARFIIADVTDPRSIPHELAFVVPTTKVPVQPVMLLGETTYTMFDDLRAWPWVLETYRYASPEQLIADLGERVIRPAEAKALELWGVKPETKGPVA